MTDRGFLSIGEVLELLKDEFPDITISKIRFLESQGLLDPERTPSGYRKFYDPDVARLRWILRQQKEHFLPLKVIKGRLAETPAEHGAPPEGASPQRALAGLQEAVTPSPRPEVSAPTDSPPASAAPGRQSRPVQEEQHLASRGSPLVAGATAVSMTIDELAQATGLDHAALKELEQFGLLVGRPVAGQIYYDEEALVAARLAAGFAKHGVEARHLRMYKVAAEREAGFYEQVVLPLLKQRNPTARRQAVETLEDLARLGEGMRSAFLRAALREYTDG